MSSGTIATGHADQHATLGHNLHAHKENFITKYIFSQDHKTIAKQYLITGIIMGVVGGLMSSLFRLQLGWQTEAFPILETILGDVWAPGGRISANHYMAMVTMHGTIMVFFVLTAGLSGTFSNLLIPLQIGARDMASPFLNMLSYWFFFLSCIIMLSSFFVQAGPAAVGWTIYPPLSALPESMPGSGAGMTLWLLSMFLFVVSVLMGGLNYIATILNMRTPGLSMNRLPLTIWSLFFTAVLGLLTFPVLVSAVLLLFFDRSFGTAFYLSDIVLQTEVLAGQTGGSPILFQHLFWFLGHPEVYIVILPAFGMTSEILAVNARKPIFGYRAMIGSIMAIVVLSFLVWGHHMFVTGMNPFLGSVFLFTTLLIAIPSAVKVFNWLATIWRGRIHFTPAMMFALGFISLFISGGLTGLFLGNAAVDIPLHNTYFVIAHFHIVMGSSAIFGMFGGVYHWFPKMFGRFMNNTWGHVHFWLTFISIYLVFFPMHFMGMGGVPRRYYMFTNFETFKVWVDLNEFISIAAIIGFLAQFIFIVNFFYSIFKGKKSPRNPWKATTLEWTTPLLPGHGNWKGLIPVVYRWPYDYSNPESELDYIPQNVSDNDLKANIDYDREDYDPETDTVEKDRPQPGREGQEMMH